MENIRKNFIEELIEHLREIKTDSPEKFDLSLITKQIHDFENFWKYSPSLIWTWAKEAVQSLPIRGDLDDNDSRNIENVMARSLFASCMRKVTNGKASLEIIGSYLKKDHSSILFHVRKLENYSDKNYPHLYACILRFDAIFEERRHLL